MAPGGFISFRPQGLFSSRINRTKKADWVKAKNDLITIYHYCHKNGEREKGKKNNKTATETGGEIKEKK